MRSLLFLGLLSLAVARKTFFGDQVLTVHLENEAQAKTIRDLETKVDFWSPDSPYSIKAGTTADFRVPSEILPAVKVTLRRQKIQFEVKIEDVEILLQAQTESRDAKGILNGGIDYDYSVYHTYDEIMQWTTDIEKENPTLVKKTSIGTSTEGRDLPMLTLSKYPNTPRILIDCGIHAREWIAPAYCQCLVRTLLGGGTITTGIPTLNDATYHILPLLNPDGYVYSRESDRMWRKTRSRYTGNVCYGTDPNRNFKAAWSGPGSSANSCSDTYYGPSAESEPEVKALADYVRDNADDLKMYVTFHSYSQVIIYPYSYKDEMAPNGIDLGDFAQEGAAAAKATHGKTYTYGPGSESMYLAAGGSDDFTYDQGVPIVYTIELRDTGLNGFLLPERQILAQCEEMDQLMGVLQNRAKTYSYP